MKVAHTRFAELRASLPRPFLSLFNFLLVLAPCESHHAHSGPMCTLSGLYNETCDMDHYCTYIAWDAYANVQFGGIICVAACSAITVSQVPIVWDPQFLFLAMPSHKEPDDDVRLVPIPWR